MQTNYRNKGPRKQFDKMVNLNVKQKMYDDLCNVADKEEVTLSDVMRRAIAKELERSK